MTLKTELSPSFTPEKLETDGICFPLLDGKIETPSSFSKMDKSFQSLFSDSLKTEDFKGKAGEIKSFHTHSKVKSRYISAIGLGSKKKFDLESFRKAGGKIAQWALSLKLKKICFVLSDFPDTVAPIESSVEALMEGIHLGSYRFTHYKSKKEAKEPHPLKEVLLIVPSDKLAECKKSVQRAETLSKATLYARDLINLPASDVNPEMLGKEALKITGIQTKVFHLTELKKMKMEGIVGVGQGSKNPPVLIEMIYKPKKPKKVIALVGKGVTFDSGGLSLKPAKSMETMKDDMSGAATLIAIMSVIAQLKPEVEVRAYVPSAENMPDGAALRPGDVLTMFNGKTVEVLNTDAEGRLILADALSYAATKKPDLIVDLATLTGACLVALGELYSAIMGNDQKLVSQLIETGKKSGEWMWELPLVEEYKEDIKSEIADIQNTGGMYAGSITAGLFLQEFVNEIPWAHLDIAGPSWANKPLAYCPKGGTGILVRTLSRFLMSF